MKDHEIDNILKIDKIYSADNEKSCCYRFLSTDRYSRYQWKHDYRQLSNYWLVFRYLFLSTALVKPCRNRTGDRGARLAWNLTVFFLPFLHSSLVWNNLFQVKYMIDSKIVVGLEIPIGFKANFFRVRCRGERLELRAPVHYRATVMAAFHASVRFQQVICSFCWKIFPKAEVICCTGKHSILDLVTP